MGSGGCAVVAWLLLFEMRKFPAINRHRGAIGMKSNYMFKPTAGTVFRLIQVAAGRLNMALVAKHLASVCRTDDAVKPK